MWYFRLFVVGPSVLLRSSSVWTGFSRTRSLISDDRTTGGSVVSKVTSQQEGTKIKFRSGQIQEFLWVFTFFSVYMGEDQSPKTSTHYSCCHLMYFCRLKVSNPVSIQQYPILSSINQPFIVHDKSNNHLSIKWSKIAFIVRLTVQTKLKRLFIYYHNWQKKAAVPHKMLLIKTDGNSFSFNRTLSCNNCDHD